MSDLLVAKFGGWSVGTAKNTDVSIDIVAQDARRRVIVVSGPKGLTNLYIQAARERILGKSSFQETYAQIQKRWQELCSGLELQEDLNQIEAHSEKAFSSYNGPQHLGDDKAQRFVDDIARLGEYFEAKYVFVPRLNARGIPSVFLDPNGVIYGKGNPGNGLILDESKDNLRRRILDEGMAEKGVVVIPGFYCYTKDGHIVTLRRGGSDTTGSFVANTLDARVYENFTNSMIRRASPDAVEGALPLEIITYAEALELTYMGFGILKDEAIVPCMDKCIPIHVIDTLNPKDVTRILENRSHDKYDITGVAYKPGFVSIGIRRIRMVEEDASLTPYVLHTEMGISRGDFPIEQITTGVSDISFLIPGDKITDEKLHDLVRHLREYFKLQASDISTRHNISLISVVGGFMKDKVGINYRVAGSLALQGISTSHLIQGGSELSILYGVQETTSHPIRAREGVKAIYNEFFVEPVFGKVIQERRQ